MPRLWTETIQSHRQEVRDAVIDATARLVEEKGLLGVTMSRIAQVTGIGRATLYKYFPDIEAILHAWHAREISRHLGELAAARDRAGTPRERLEAVLEAYALIARGSHGHRDSELAAFLHRDEQVLRAQTHLTRMITDLLVEGVRTGEIRGDVSAEELASFCLHGLAAARTMRSKAAVSRLVDVVLAGVSAGA